MAKSDYDFYKSHKGVDFSAIFQILMKITIPLSLNINSLDLQFEYY